MSSLLSTILITSDHSIFQAIGTTPPLRPTRPFARISIFPCHLTPQWCPQFAPPRPSRFRHPHRHRHRHSLCPLAANTRGKVWGTFPVGPRERLRKDARRGLMLCQRGTEDQFMQGLPADTAEEAGRMSRKHELPKERRDRRSCGLVPPLHHFTCWPLSPHTPPPYPEGGGARNGSWLDGENSSRVWADHHTVLQAALFSPPNSASVHSHVGLLVHHACNLLFAAAAMQAGDIHRRRLRLPCSVNDMPLASLPWPLSLPYPSWIAEPYDCARHSLAAAAEHPHVRLLRPFATQGSTSCDVHT